jgi:phage baseplate assembly protein W
MSNIYNISGISLDLLTVLGNVKTKISNQKFHEDLRVLLETKRGTTIGDPEFGSDLLDLLFEPANNTTASLIRNEVVDAISRYYENVVVEQVDVTFKAQTVQLLIYYKVFNTNIGDTIMLEFIKGDSR